MVMYEKMHLQYLVDSIVSDHRVLPLGFVEMCDPVKR